jgi:hypothetical protein
MDILSFGPYLEYFAQVILRGAVSLSPEPHLEDETHR